ncbi:MAG: DUF2911 domain-containing protein [Saprospiraceae bacterium]|jgi:hypothetical protein|nr:DUF2911 domain-containing protein [Saprospiraceae bacterium]MBL0027342.1 DUF2911 domain-containing protein [Saprospiraceae bacterium]
MKNIFNFLLFGALVMMFSSTQAQIATPAPSQTAKLETTVGLTKVVLEYSRPSKNGRKIYGDLVPFDALWRTGANKNSMISFSDDVKIGGTDVKKGNYAIFTKPGKASWDVYFYSDTENWGTPEKWDETKVAAKVMVTPQSANTVETLTMNIANVTNDGCNLEITWDNVNIPVKIEVPTDKKVSEAIAQVMSGPSAGDYYNAATYYRTAKKDLKQALAWMNKSIEMGNDKYWVLRQKSLIQSDMGDYKGAVETAKMSLTKATEAANKDYIKMNNDSIAMWSKK